MDSNVAEVSAVEAVVVATKPKKKPAKKVAGLKANRDGITAYQTKKGVRFLAQVRLAGRDQKSKGGFLTYDEASKWKKSEEIVEVEVARNEVPASLTIAQLCLDYLTEAEKRKKTVSYSRTRYYTRMSKNGLFQSTLLAKADSNIIRKYCEYRIAIDGVDQSTVTGEFAYLKVAIRRMVGWKNWGAFSPFEGTRAQLREDNLMAESTERDRRPSAHELDILRAYFREQAAMKHPLNYIQIPMEDICDVASLNAFRQGELVKLSRTAIDREYGTIACRRKDASAKDGTGKRDTKVPLLEASLAIIDRQPIVEGEDRIFPFRAAAVSKRFTEACFAVGINTADTPEDQRLRFHDLRHEAISTAAQHVPNLSQLKAFSGHKTAKHLGRYIHNSNEDLKNIGGMMSYGRRTAIA